MNATTPIAERIFARGFILSDCSASELREALNGAPRFVNVMNWKHTFFGPCTLWVDPLLNYARRAGDRFGVGIMGLCVNPFDGLADNQKIADALYTALTQGKDAFFDYADQLTGSFVIIFRENADVFLLQDTAATKPVYYHRDRDGRLTATGHVAILQKLHGLVLDLRAQAVYDRNSYKKDPSRYLPGMITPYEGALPLTANNMLEVRTGTSKRFFPREDLCPRAFDDSVVDDIADIMVQQAQMIGAMGRPMTLAATGGRDSRVSAVTFSGQAGLSYFSFHMPRIGHLSEDVEVARKLAEIEQIELNIYDLDHYKDPEFRTAFKTHSPRGIWPAAALCYLREFTPDTIHIRSTVSEIGRVFYGRRVDTSVSPEGLARTFTATDFHSDPMVVDTMRDFIELTNFDDAQFFNYDLHDMFYWEHRNSKWQNVLCSEAEMATDVFIPFNNRNLLKLFMSVPYKHRLQADLHLAVCRKLKPEFDAVEIV